MKIKLDKEWSSCTYILYCTYLLFLTNLGLGDLVPGIVTFTSACILTVAFIYHIIIFMTNLKWNCNYKVKPDELNKQFLFYVTFMSPVLVNWFSCIYATIQDNHLAICYLQTLSVLSFKYFSVNKRLITLRIWFKIGLKVSLFILLLT